MFVWYCYSNSFTILTRSWYSEEETPAWRSFIGAHCIIWMVGVLFHYYLFIWKEFYYSYKEDVVNNGKHCVFWLWCVLKWWLHSPLSYSFMMRRCAHFWSVVCQWWFACRPSHIVCDDGCKLTEFYCISGNIHAIWIQHFLSTVYFQ